MAWFATAAPITQGTRLCWARHRGSLRHHWPPEEHRWCGWLAYCGRRFERGCAQLAPCHRAMGNLAAASPATPPLPRCDNHAASRKATNTPDTVPARRAVVVVEVSFLFREGSGRRSSADTRIWPIVPVASRRLAVTSRKDAPASAETQTFSAARFSTTLSQPDTATRSESAGETAREPPFFP